MLRQKCAGTQLKTLQYEITAHRKGVRDTHLAFCEGWEVIRWQLLSDESPNQPIIQLFQKVRPKNEELATY